MSLAETITNSSQLISGPNLIFLILPRGMELRTVAPKIIPGSVMSSMYSARPVTLSTPSFLGTAVPMMGSVVIRIVAGREKSALGLELPAGSLPGKPPFAKNQPAAQVGSLHHAAQSLAEVRRKRVAMMQGALCHRELRLRVENREISVVTFRNPSFSSVAAGELRGLSRHPLGDIGQRESACHCLGPHHRQSHREAGNAAPGAAEISLGRSLHRRRTGRMVRDHHVDDAVFQPSP